MGLLDYYKQFEALADEEVNRDLRERAHERRKRELARVDPLDLSRTTWHELPHPAVVGAITYAARRGMHTYADPHAAALRAELARRHDVPRDRVVVGAGAAQLLQAAAFELLEPGDELITPWPSYPMYPLMARRARGHAVPVPGFGAAPLLAAVNERTRIVCVCNPNDPTGELLGAGELRALLEQLPERAVVLLDEALVDFAGQAAGRVAPALLDEHPRLLVFRTFSKAWGLAGLRCGYVLGGPGSEPLLEHLEPAVGVDELSQAGALEALRTTGPRLPGRVAAMTAERAHLQAALRERGIEVAPSHANVLWFPAPGGDAVRLADALSRAGVMVATGAALGEPGHLRVTVRDRPATERFLAALDGAAA